MLKYNISNATYKVSILKAEAKLGGCVCLVEPSLGVLCLATIALEHPM